MKKLLVSAFALAAFTGPAIAADFEPVPTMYDWNGAYLGGHVGYLWGNADVREEFGPGYGGDFDGFIGGVIGGWNFQNGNWVFGIEGDFGWTGADGTGGTTCVTQDCSDIDFYTYDMDWNAHVRGRAGITLGDEGRTLVFLAGGLAIADFDVGARHLGRWSRGGTFTGWSIGGGVNHAFSNNLIGGIEALYDDYGSKSYDRGGVEPCQELVCEVIRISGREKISLDAVTVRGTLTYHFTY